MDMDMDMDDDTNLKRSSTSSSLNSSAGAGSSTDEFIKKEQESEVEEGDADPDLAKKGRSLAELLALMDDYSPIPDAVTDYYLARSGFECSDVRIKRLLGLATQKFISDIATDALQYSKLRQQSASSKDRGRNPYRDKRSVLTVDDLASALGDHGVQVKKPEYFL